MQICYLNSTKICLLGYTSLGSANWSTCCGYTWTVTIAAGKLTTNARTITGVKIPTLENIYSTTANYVRNFDYWESTPYGNMAWNVWAKGAIDISNTTTLYAAIPYVTINL